MPSSRRRREGAAPPTCLLFAVPIRKSIWTLWIQTNQARQLVAQGVQQADPRSPSGGQQPS
jgi:hypothetical protein